jgi:hypothetical protein
MKASFTLSTVVCGLLACPPGTVAQTKVPPAFLGTWQGAGFEQDLKGFPEGTPPAELPYLELDKRIGDYMQPWALALREVTEWNIDDIGQVCKFTGIFRQGHASGGGFRFVEAPGKIYQLGNGVDVRGITRIYLDAPRPASVLPTWNGDARGRFEGDDTFIVDVAAFNDKSWLNSDRWVHTEELRVVERYQLFGGGGFMKVRVFVEDRKALKVPYTYTRYYRKVPEPTQGGTNICNENLPGEDLWRIRRDALLAEREAIFDALIAKYPKETLPQGASATNGPVPHAAAPGIARFTGIYQAVPLQTALPGGLRGSGMLNDLALTASAAATAKARDLMLDPAKHCRAIGPFRMMARAGTKFEILTTANRMTVVFEDTTLGSKREIYLARSEHPAKLEPSWLGDSIASLDGDTLVVRTTGFNDLTWMNDQGAPHSSGLRLVERYRLVGDGRYLEVQVTAEDPEALAKPFTYTRYFEKVNAELAESFCVETA